MNIKLPALLLFLTINSNLFGNQEKIEKWFHTLNLKQKNSEKFPNLNSLRMSNPEIVYAIDNQENNALHVAVKNINPVLVRFLLDHKVETNQKNIFGFTPLALAIEIYEDLIHEYKKLGNFEFSNKRNKTKELSAQIKNLKQIIYLLWYKSSWWIRNNRFSNSLHVLVENNENEFINIVFKNNKITPVLAKRINYKDMAGNTVLHLAAKNNNPKLVELFIKLGADKEIRNMHLQTALDIANEKMYEKVQSVFLNIKIN